MRCLSVIPFPLLWGDLLWLLIPKTPPIIPHQGCFGIESNWVQISVLLLTTRLLNFWTLYFFTFKLGVHLMGLPRGRSWAIAHAQPTESVWPPAGAYRCEAPLPCPVPGDAGSWTDS